MTISQILANDVKAGRLGFSAAVHRLVEMSEMRLEMAHCLIHTAMVKSSPKSTPTEATGE